MQIRCSYTDQPDRSKRNQSKKINKKISDDVHCPFGVWYNYVNNKHNLREPDSFRYVKVTRLESEHTCGLSTISHRLAKSSRGDNMKIPLDSMRFIGRLIGANPNIPTNTLRPHLKEFLPHWVPITDVYCRSIRRKINNYFLTNGLNSQLDADSSSKIIRKGAAYETIDVDDDFISKNLSIMLKQVMRQDNTMWKAQRYCEKLKTTVAGFDYKIHVDGRIDEPDAILWITPSMRNVLKRYPDILSLDMQKRQYNLLNWPYCSLIFHSGHGHGEPGCECIVCEESHSMYQWILETCASIEPHFPPNQIKIIFGDNLITKELLVNLGIQNTCQLHCDYHHQKNIVWPKLFGSNNYNKIIDHLELILKCDSVDEFSLACSSAKSKLYQNQTLVNEIDKIQNDPSYYAGYYLKTRKD